MRKPTMVFLLVALAAISAAMLVDLSPASPRQNVPATKQTVSGLSGALSQPARVPGSPANQLVANYGKLPLAFEANDGQTDGRVKFLSRGRGYSLFLTGDEAVLSLHKATGGAPNFRSASARVAQHSLFGAAVLPDPLSLSMPKEESENEAEKPRDRRTGPALPFSSPRLADNIESSAVLRMRLVGANASAAVTGAEELPGKSNYFIGNDPKKWRTNVPNYAKVKYQDVYPGVDLVYYGNQGGQLEYDFVVAPGADPETIRFALSGGLQESSRQSAVGSRAQNQTLRQSKIQNLKSKIDPSGDLVIETDGGEVRLHKPVVYQPAISNGQRTTDYGQRAPVEGHYVMQANNQVGFKVASYDHTRPLLIDPVLSYSTYLGGSFTDLGYHITVDSSGNAYVTGDTLSQNFPTANPFQATNKATPTTSNPTAFVAKLNSTGSALVYSTYLGGSNEDVGTGIAVDSSGNAYVTGYTTSTNFPTVNPLQVSNGGGYDAFVSKLNAAGSALTYSTYLGGSNEDVGTGIAVDSSSNAYVTGYTSSTDFPTVSPLQASYGGGNLDAFVAKFDAAGSALIYSTYLGGGGTDRGYGIAIDSSANAYVTGETISNNFPTTPGAFQQATADACAHFPPGYIPFTQVYYISDGVLVGEMTQASYSTLLAAVPLPITPSPYGFCEEPIQLAPGVFQPAQVPTAAERHGDFSSFLPFNLTNPLTGNPYINNMIPLSFPGPMAWPVGSDFPFPGPGGDAFVAKIDAVNAAALAISAQTLSFTAAVGSSSSQNLTLRSTGSENLRLLGMLAFPPSFSAATDPCSRTLSPGETCTITVTFRPRRVGVQQGSLLIFDNAYRRPETLIRLTGTGE